jgi:hypothetical protein
MKMTNIDQYIATHTEHHVSTTIDGEEWTLTAEVTQPLRVYVSGPDYNGTGRVRGIPNSMDGLRLGDFTQSPPFDALVALESLYLAHLVAIGWCK